MWWYHCSWENSRSYISSTDYHFNRLVISCTLSTSHSINSCTLLFTKYLDIVYIRQPWFKFNFFLFVYLNFCSRTHVTPVFRSDIFIADYDHSTCRLLFDSLKSMHEIWWLFINSSQLYLAQDVWHTALGRILVNMSPRFQCRKDRGNIAQDRWNNQCHKMKWKQYGCLSTPLFIWNINGGRGKILILLVHQMISARWKILMNASDVSYYQLPAYC